MLYKVVGDKFVGTRELPIVIWDWDDTLGALAAHWIASHNELTGSSFNVEHLTTWDFESILGDRVYESLTKLDNYSHFHPFPEVATKLKRLEPYAKQLIATASRTGAGAASKIELSKKLFPHYEIWKADSKHNIRAFALVDDNPATAKSAKESGMLTLAIKHPWHNAQTVECYDLLAESYLDPSRAIDTIVDYLIQALKSAKKPKISGKRYNSGKPAFDLLPPTLFSILINIRNGRVVSNRQLLSLLTKWRCNQDNTSADLILLKTIIEILVARLWESVRVEHETEMYAGLAASYLVAQVLTGGAIKYEPRNWEKGLSFLETWASGMRHIIKGFRGEKLDVESGLEHWAHAICNFCFLYHFTEFYKSKYEQHDDRKG